MRFFQQTIGLLTVAALRTTSHCKAASSGPSATLPLAQAAEATVCESSSSAAIAPRRSLRTEQRHFKLCSILRYASWCQFAYLCRRCRLASRSRPQRHSPRHLRLATWYLHPSLRQSCCFARSASSGRAALRRRPPQRPHFSPPSCLLPETDNTENFNHAFKLRLAYRCSSLLYATT